MKSIFFKNNKFDFIAFFIAFCMVVTLASIVVSDVYIFVHNGIDAETRQQLTFNIGVFGSMFGVEGLAGIVYNIFKKKYKVNEQ